MVGVVSGQFGRMRNVSMEIRAPASVVRATSVRNRFLSASATALGMIVPWQFTVHLPDRAELDRSMPRVIVVMAMLSIPVVVPSVFPVVVATPLLLGDVAHHVSAAAARQVVRTRARQTGPDLHFDESADISVV